MQPVSDRPDDFARAFTAVSGLPHIADNITQAAALIRDIMSQASISRAAIANVAPDWLDPVATECRRAGIELLQGPFESQSLPRALDGVQAGITGMSFGIAQTGTLAEVATNDAVRLVSGLPRTHIALVRASDLVPRFEDAAPRIRENFSRHGSNCVISFISGPSRTGDIELILTLGVHGPETAHAIIIRE